MQLFSHYNDRAGLVLAAIFVVGYAVLFTFTWQDSWRSLRELLAPFRLLQHPRFRLIHLCAALVVASLIAKLASQWHWSESNWIEYLGRLAAISLGLSLLVSFLWFCCSDIFGRRQKLRSDVVIQLPDQDAEQTSVRKPKLKIRFDETKRQLTAFKRWVG